ncbi:hypothetical protein [Burkholderia sp. 9777_1386]|uniref:hypothetical protein n=1 Tax=Burkholderia sp. 9777_1386 TaxID=2751183 RepID=UPI001E59BA7E|nr:hypothetical protein [Burkholderia sp. 9777_1386]
MPQRIARGEDSQISVRTLRAPLDRAMMARHADVPEDAADVCHTAPASGPSGEPARTVARPDPADAHDGKVSAAARQLGI